MIRYTAVSTGLLLLAIALASCGAAIGNSIAENTRSRVVVTDADAFGGAYDPYHYRCLDRCLSGF